MTTTTLTQPGLETAEPATLEGREVNNLVDLLLAQLEEKYLNEGANHYQNAVILYKLLSAHGLEWANPFNEENRKQIYDKLHDEDAPLIPALCASFSGGRAAQCQVPPILIGLTLPEAETTAEALSALAEYEQACIGAAGAEMTPVFGSEDPERLRTIHGIAYLIRRQLAATNA